MNCFEAVLLFVAVLVTNACACGQGLQMTPRDEYDAIRTRSDTQIPGESLESIHRLPQISRIGSDAGLLRIQNSPSLEREFSPPGASLIQAEPATEGNDRLAVSDGPGTNLPDRMDLRKYLPPPGKQQSQNDCVAWALGYSSYSCQMSQERRRSPQAECDKFSPAFIYNELQKDGKGLMPMEAINFVKNIGCA